MEFLAQNWYLLVIAAVTGGMLLWPNLRGVGAGISAQQAVFTLNREKGFLLDVRQPEEFSRSRALGAVNVPLGNLSERLGDLPKNRKTPLVVLCESGARAERAAQQLRKQGFESVQVVQGGMRAWSEAQLPVESGAAAASGKKSEGKRG